MNTWSQVRAALLAVVIGGNLLVALPVGPKITEKSLAKPRNMDEVDVWMRLAGPLGFTRASFEETLIVWSDRLVEADRLATSPMRPFFRHAKVGQSWGLFSSADDDPYRFQVRGTDAEGRERLLFSRLDPEATFMADVFGFRRVRGVYDLGSSKKVPPVRYRNLCRWVAARAFEAFPGLERVEIVQVESRTAPPTEPQDPTTEEKLRIAFRKADVEAWVVSHTLEAVEEAP